MIDFSKFVVHSKKSPFDVYVGRPSKFGNQFSHLDHSAAEFKVATREEAVENYREWVLTQPKLLEDIKQELHNKILGCWCAPLKCHAEVLAEIANSP